jgi:hypothetical protein
MKKAALLYWVVGAIVLLMVVKSMLPLKEGFATYTSIEVGKKCPKGKVYMQFGKKAYCFEKGDYGDTSGFFLGGKKKCEFDTKDSNLKVQLYYNQYFNTPTKLINKDEIVKVNCWPYSIKVF